MKIYLSQEHALDVSVTKVNPNLYQITFDTIDIVPSLCSKSQFFLNTEQFKELQTYFASIGE